MKYYLIAGEASGDLHASNLMRALKACDEKAEFRFFGGDLMQEVGGTLVKHYRELAYMGFVQVALHAGTIIQGMKLCKEDIVAWKPDVVILVDYPGFNLSIAKYVKTHTQIPVYYYISPKIWAWKEYRIKDIRQYVDELFSILPFEVPYFARHAYPIHYVGNPCVDAIAQFKGHYTETREEFCARHGLNPEQPIVALLAGSRKQEIRDNLPIMLATTKRFEDFQWVIAGAPGIDPEMYKQNGGVHVVYGETYPLLSHAYAAMVTSGTATLETALFRVPQVVCYYMKCGRVVSWLRSLLLKVPYISLVNLVADGQLVRELVAHEMCEQELSKELDKILLDASHRTRMLAAYDSKVIGPLGEPGASEHAAEMMVSKLKIENYHPATVDC
ncbi:MAG: lipid-A-disaccharide synthase [Bacteroidaceae bacterium]|nr:lipid-A-disaccharide synthase [Bacteroidaceae bacterium]